MNQIINEYARFERNISCRIIEWNVFGKITTDEFNEYNLFEWGFDKVE